MRGFLRSDPSPGFHGDRLRFQFFLDGRIRIRFFFMAGRFWFLILLEGPGPGPVFFFSTFGSEGTAAGSATLL